MIYFENISVPMVPDDPIIQNGNYSYVQDHELSTSMQPFFVTRHPLLQRTSKKNYIG